jgi:hypothetical protein
VWIRRDQRLAQKQVVFDMVLVIVGEMQLAVFCFSDASYYKPFMKLTNVFG